MHLMQANDHQPKITSRSDRAYAGGGRRIFFREFFHGNLHVNGFQGNGDHSLARQVQPLKVLAVTPSTSMAESPTKIKSELISSPKPINADLNIIVEEQVSVFSSLAACYMSFVFDDFAASLKANIFLFTNSLQKQFQVRFF